MCPQFNEIVNALLQQHLSDLKALVAGHRDSVAFGDGLIAHRMLPAGESLGGRWYGEISRPPTEMLLKFHIFEDTVAVGTAGDSTFEPFRLLGELLPACCDAETLDQREAVIKATYELARPVQDTPVWQTSETACLACQEESNQPFASGLLRCHECGTLFRGGSGDAQFQAAYSDPEGHYFNQMDARVELFVGGHGYENYDEWIRVILGLEHFKNRLEWALSWNPDARTYLDVGCASGHAVEAGLRLGLDSSGIDLSPWGVEQARRRTPQGHFQVGRLDSLPDTAQFDLISYFDVLEHISHPLRELRLARKHLSQGGLLFLELPNQGSIEARILGNDYLFSEHVYFYTPDAATQLVQRAGLEIVQLQSRHDHYLDLRPALGRRLAELSEQTLNAERLLILARRP